jgi:hypothetical protein
VSINQVECEARIVDRIRPSPAQPLPDVQNEPFSHPGPHNDAHIHREVSSSSLMASRILPLAFSSPRYAGALPPTPSPPRCLHLVPLCFDDSHVVALLQILAPLHCPWWHRMSPRGRHRADPCPGRRGRRHGRAWSHRRRPVGGGGQSAEEEEEGQKQAW